MIDTGLRDRVAIVTGANHGIGAAVARALAGEGAKVFITYLPLDPAEYGGIDRAMAKQARETLDKSYPLRRVGRPEDIANAVLFLASKQADWITGQVLHVGGGNRM